MTFQEIGIIEPIIKAVQELGFSQPMPVQEAVIPHLLGESEDLIALAQTGTGKTAAYGLPLLQLLREGRKLPQTIVLTPTRELCVQVAQDLERFGKYLPFGAPLAIYGGASIEMQIKALKKNPPVIVATPGRMLDILRRKATSLKEVHTVVLDEADIMLDMGFRDDLEEILQQVDHREHLLLFSATMSAEIKKIAGEYLHAPKEIQIGERNVTNQNIKHQYCMVPAKHKYNALKRLVDFYPDVYGIVFCRTRAETKEVAEWLIRDGYNADALHGDLSQAQRDMVMNRFRIRNIQLLVATDVAARGLDVNDLTHVLHYGLPDDLESYTHRSGRTARAGKTGYSIAICHLREKSRIRSLEKNTQALFEVITLPSGQEICAKHLFHLADKIEQSDLGERNQDMSEILDQICAKLSWIDREELIRRVMMMEFDRLFAYYRSAQEIDLEEQQAPASRRGGKQRVRRTSSGVAEEGMTRLFINLGKRDRLFPNKLIELINKVIPGRIDIGKIDLMSNFSFFDVENERAQDVVEELSAYEVQGRQIIVDYADAAPSDGGKAGRKERGKQQRRAMEEGGKGRRASAESRKGSRSVEGAKRKSSAKQTDSTSSRRSGRGSASWNEDDEYNYPKAHGSKFIPAPGAKKKKR